MIRNKSLINSYFEIHQIYQQKYNKCIVIMNMNGCVYQAYETFDEGPNLSYISSLLHLNLIKSNVANIDRLSPDRILFPGFKKKQIVDILTNDGYTVVETTILCVSNAFGDKQSVCDIINLYKPINKF